MKPLEKILALEAEIASLRRELLQQTLDSLYEASAAVCRTGDPAGILSDLHKMQARMREVLDKA